MLAGGNAVRFLRRVFPETAPFFFQSSILLRFLCWRFFGSFGLNIGGLSGEFCVNFEGGNAVRFCIVFLL